MQGRTQERPEPVIAETSLGRCLVDGDAATESGGRRTRRKAFGMSLTVETVLLALLVMSPLLTSIAQPQLHNLPPMPIVLGSWHTHHATQPTPSKPSQSVHPVAYPPAQFAFPAPNVKIRNDAEENDDANLVPHGEIISGATQMDELGVKLPKVDLPHINPPITHEKQTMKVSEGVEQGQMISRIEPQYPILAKETGTQGTVLLHAIISREGRITSLEVLSGHPLLVRAALEAVRQWRYRPTLLNGEPVEVETSITVIFRLDN